MYVQVNIKLLINLLATHFYAIQYIYRTEQFHTMEILCVTL